MGKSYMADYVREHLQTLGHPCSTFFFKAGEAARSSLSRYLIILAYGMACHIATIRDIFLEMQDDDVHIEPDHEKPRHIWQNLFVNGILNQTLCRPFYWVVDALDECKKMDELLQLISGINPTFPLRIFFTSQPSHELSSQLSLLRTPAEIVEILPENTPGNIKHYVQIIPISRTRATKGASATCPYNLGEVGRLLLAVKLVLKELKQVQSSRTTQRILQQMPKGIDKLYNRTLAELSTASAYTKPLTKAILKWTLCSMRPLTVEELKYVLMADIEDEVQNLKHHIPILYDTYYSLTRTNESDWSSKPREVSCLTRRMGRNLRF